MFNLGNTEWQNYLKVLGATLGVLLLGILLTRIFKVPEKKVFCTIEDEIYKTIEANSDSWLQYFFGSQRHKENLEFSVQDTTYVARADLSSDRTQLFYVATGVDWPATLQGLNGYIYIPSGNLPPDYWPPAYNIKRLNNNIFCYSEYKIDNK